MSAKRKTKKPKRPRRAPKPAPRKPAPIRDVDRDAYARHTTAAAARQEKQSRSGRDIGPIRPIADVARREACHQDPERFCLTYNPEAFKLPFCQDHRDAIARIKEAFTLGALYAFAMDRGKGKTTLCRMLALWTMSYGILRYLFMIGANATKAEDNLAALKSYIRFLPRYREDFPEISQAAEHLGGIAQKAGGQLCNGEPTLIEWSQDRIILPTVPTPDNWPKKWPRRADCMAPTSGSVIGASGLTGDGLRGSLLTLNTGESLRPDGVLLDDPQTPESARSLTQIATRTQLISADILGMAGPGKTISAVMPCTVIAPGDMIDQVLDRKKNPVWRGERRGILRSMPKNLEAWDRYFEVYAECAQKEPPDYDAANAYYCGHRAELDAGAEASWPERKLPHEISAVQHAMHLYFRDKFSFWSEFMNRPLAPVMEGKRLESDKVAARVSGLEEGIVPLNASILTAGVDVGQNVLWFVVAAWEPTTFTGSIIAYGAWPQQDQPYFTNSDAKRTLGLAYPDHDEDGAIQSGLSALASWLLGREWVNEGKTPLKIGLQLVDSKWKPDTVCEWCRRSEHAAIILPSQGRYVGAKSIKHWHQFEKRPGERLGLHWLIGPIAKSKRATRIAAVDVNFWKTTIAEKLTVSPANKGAITIWGRPGQDHRMLADHCCAQFWTDVSANGRTVREWQVKPDRKDQDHLWDCLVYATAAASIQGCVLPATAESQPAKKGASWSQRQKSRRRG